MTHSQLRALQQETRLSPEQFGARLGISGMTLRRWAARPGDEAIPALYEKAISEVIFEMVADGTLPSESPFTHDIMGQTGGSAFRAAFKILGFTEDFLRASNGSEENVLTGLGQIGENSNKQAIVNRSHDKIMGYGRLSAEWKNRVQSLVKVVTSQKLSVAEKCVAYGALFYLICPFDLIPDHVPVFGLMDDFFILGVALVFYLKNFAHILNDPN